MKAWRILLAVAVLSLLAVGGAGAWAWRALHAPYAGWSGDSVDVVLEPGLSAGGMFQRLAERGVVQHPELLRLWVRYKDDSGGLHAGEYRFDAPRSPLDVLEALKSGDVLLYPVTLPEGLEMSAVARRMEEAGFGNAAEFEAAFADPALIADLDAEAQDLEGYLFPDTYHFAKSATPASITAKLVQRFRESVEPEVVAGAAEVGLTLREVVVLASMIEKETSVPDERGRISRVFHNRLELGMKMQCDPTTRYGLMRAGKPVGKLTYRDLEFDSPWNTYVVFGLPVGPIANPGLASLEAAIHPIDSQELYFVAAPGGGHRFSEDLDGHNRAVAEWRRYSRSR